MSRYESKIGVENNGVQVAGFCLFCISTCSGSCSGDGCSGSCRGSCKGSCASGCKNACTSQAFFHTT